MPLGANKVALFGVAGVSTGTAVLLSTATASDDASIEFTLPTAYKQLCFGFYAIVPATSITELQFQCSTDGGSNYNKTITSTAFRAWHKEDDSATNLSYAPLADQAQGTAYQELCNSIFTTDGDETATGHLYLYSPTSTTYVKHFQAASCAKGQYPVIRRYGGYINDGSNDLTNISFKMSSGNISSGTIKMWGIK